MTDEKNRPKKRSKVLVRDRDAVREHFIALTESGITRFSAEKQTGNKFGYTDYAMSAFYADDIGPALEVRKKDSLRHAREAAREDKQAKARRRTVRYKIGCPLAVVTLIAGVWWAWSGARTGNSPALISSSSDTYASCERRLKPVLEDCLHPTDQSGWRGCKQIYLDAMADCTGKDRDPL